MLRLFILGLAGFLGTISRYLLGGWICDRLGSEFPYGTLIVNVTGSLAIGFLGTLSDERFLLNSQVRSVLFLGFLGAFTTFSSFTYETWNLLKDGEIFLAGFNVFGSLLACFLGLAVGIFAARLL